MNRLQSELLRLFPLPERAGDRVTGPAEVRVLVLGLARPADWAALSQVWQGVQADLGLPAPAIAVSGSDGFELWFPLAQAVPRSQAQAFLAGLRRRWWSDVAPRRIHQWPAAEPADPTPPPAWPGREVQTEQWSAFVSPDLAPVFAETPWLDIPPVDDGQAQLLREIWPITPAAWTSALADLAAAPVAPAPAPAAAAPSATPCDVAPATASSQRDPRQFLLDVMNDPAVDLALRIAAAKALLPTVS